MTTTTTTCPAWCTSDHANDDAEHWHIRVLGESDHNSDRVELALSDSDARDKDMEPDFMIWMGGNAVDVGNMDVTPDALRTWALMLANAAAALEELQQLAIPAPRQDRTGPSPGPVEDVAGAGLHALGR